MMRIKLQTIAWMVLTLQIISACSTSPDLRQGQSTLDIYRSSQSQTEQRLRKVVPEYGGDLRSYSRSEAHVLDIRFPLLNNPNLVLYIFPHLKDEVPVPGYITTFKLYDRNIYALPGEQ